jgi:glycosyl hydrolase family 44
LWTISATAWLAWLCAFTATTHAITPANPGAAAIQFTLNSGQNVKAISPYVYGMNFFDHPNSTLTNPVTIDRQGGNRWSAYNWETNASNAGKDYKYESDNYLVSDSFTAPHANEPGGALIHSLNAAASNNRAFIVTVPMAGWVSGDMAGPVLQADFANSTRFNQVVPKKSTIYPGSSLSLSPNKTDDYVFTDEFVNWVKSTKSPSQQVFYDLDNEPALWGETLPPGWDPNNWDNHLGNQPGRTHPEIHPSPPTFAEMKQKTIDHASAIKDTDPNAVVFGGVGYGYAEFTGLQGAPDATTSPAHPGGDHAGELNYYEYLLQQVHNAEVTQGRKLMDVLDLHWYPEATGGGVRVTENNNSAAVVAARVQAPRSLWDPTYTETSWITGCCSGGPIKLLPNVQRDIDDFNPGTKIAITEYNYGGTNHISGGIAEADALGVFGQQGLFAATFWSLYGDSQSQFASGGFKMYLNYDGSGGKFGDTSVNAATSDISQSAIYSSVDSTNPNRMVVVAINRTGSALTTGIAVTHDRVFDHAEVYQLTSSSANPVRGSDIELNLLNAFQYTMPAFSVTTLVLISDGLPGDFNHDHVVDAADFTIWRDSYGRTGNIAADANEDNIVNDADFDLWQSNFGRTEPAGGFAAGVPEPATFTLIAIAACGLVLPALRRHRAAQPSRRDR